MLRYNIQRVYLTCNEGNQKERIRARQRLLKQKHGDLKQSPRRLQGLIYKELYHPIRIP